MILLTRLAKQVYRRSSEELLGMHLRLLMALSYLRDHDGCPQQELAEVLCMDANNVVLLLNELEDLGYITRLRDPLDRRRHRVELTKQGVRALQSAEQAQESDRGRGPAGARRRANARRCGAAHARPARRRAGRRGGLQRDDRVDLDVGALRQLGDADRRPRRRLLGEERARTPR